MTDGELIDGLYALSDRDHLTDEESDLVLLAARIIERKSLAKDKAREALAAANQALGDVFTTIGGL